QQDIQDKKTGAVQHSATQAETRAAASVYDPDRPVYPVSIPPLRASDGSVIDPPQLPVQSRMYSNREEWKEYDQKRAAYDILLDQQLAREKEERERLEEERKNNPQPVDVLGRFEGMPLCPE